MKEKQNKNYSNNSAIIQQRLKTPPPKINNSPSHNLNESQFINGTNNISKNLPKISEKEKIIKQKTNNQQMKNMIHDNNYSNNYAKKFIQKVNSKDKRQSISKERKPFADLHNNKNNLKLNNK